MATRVPSSPDPDTFPLFDLPPEIVCKILREYVPVTDKSTLEQVSAFTRYFDLDNLWFSSTLSLFKLAGGLKSGWYTNTGIQHIRYLVTLDYVDLTLTVHFFNPMIQCTCACTVHSSKRSTPTEMRQFLQELSPKMVPIHERDLLFYQYPLTGWLIHVDFQVCLRTQTVLWGHGNIRYGLIHGRCHISTDRGSLDLVFLESVPDRPVQLTCQLHLPEELGSCLCGGERNRIVYPCFYKTCDARKSTTDWNPHTPCVKCQDEGDQTRIIFPHKTMTFHNVHVSNDAWIDRKSYHCVGTKLFFSLSKDQVNGNQRNDAVMPYIQ